MTGKIFTTAAQLYKNHISERPVVDTWKEVVQNGCQARNFTKEDAMDRGRWLSLVIRITSFRWQYITAY